MNLTIDPDDYLDVPSLDLQLQFCQYHPAGPAPLLTPEQVAAYGALRDAHVYLEWVRAPEVLVVIGLWLKRMRDERK